MAKVRISIKLRSTESPYFKMTTKNPRNTTEKMKLKKYDPTIRKMVEFTEEKAKS